jgi:uncharacterized protein YdaU (DUF1376 family)
VNFYSFHIGDYASKTRHLSWDEDMAYRRLLDMYYGTEKPLPKDKAVIYRLMMARTPEQKEAVDVVLGEFFEETDAGYRNQRCDEEIAGYAGKRDKARSAAFLSVEARNNKQLRAERLESARQKATHTKAEWLAMLEVCGHQCVKCGETSGIEKDHITPVYQGGSDGIANIQPLCRTCNSAKGPDTTDHRPMNWEQAFDDVMNGRSTDVQQTLNDGSAPNPNPNPNPKLETRKARVQSREVDGFEDFWAVYPRKTGKGAARKAFRNAALTADPNILFHAAERYAASKLDPKFTPHPATWLNQERWLDEELQPKPAPEPFKGTSNGQVFVKQGTDAFDAWSRWWRKTKGVSAPTNQDGGWFFPSEYPQEQAA